MILRGALLTLVLLLPGLAAAITIKCPLQLGSSYRVNQFIPSEIKNEPWAIFPAQTCRSNSITPIKLKNHFVARINNKAIQLNCQYLSKNVTCNTISTQLPLPTKNYDCVIKTHRTFICLEKKTPSPDD